MKSEAPQKQNIFKPEVILVQLESKHLWIEPEGSFVFCFKVCFGSLHNHS